MSNQSATPTMEPSPEAVDQAVGDAQPQSAPSIGMPIYQPPHLTPFYYVRPFVASQLSPIPIPMSPYPFPSPPLQHYGFIDGGIYPYQAMPTQQLFPQQSPPMGMPFPGYYDGPSLFLPPNNYQCHHPIEEGPLMNAAHLQLQPQPLPPMWNKQECTIFVGDLSEEVDHQMLFDAFYPFGSIYEAKVMVDYRTGCSRGYGFVSFHKREDAHRAIESMNGRWVGNRVVRTNWSARRLSISSSGGSGGSGGSGDGHSEEADEEGNGDKCSTANTATPTATSTSS